MNVLHARCAITDAEDETAARTVVAETGTPRGLAHAFIAAARTLGTPARYASGYRHDEAADGVPGEHGWAEAFVPAIGWIGFDPSADLCPTDRYVRLAVGLDLLGAAPARGAADGIVAKPVASVTVTDCSAAKKPGTART